MGAPGSLVIVNPNASRARDPHRRAGLVRELEARLIERDGRAPHIVETAAPEDTRPIVEAGLRQGVRAVIGMGGDGTLSDIANVLSGSGVPLGIVPAGTGNQVAAVLGIPLDPSEALATLVTAAPRTIDLGEVTLRLADGPDRRALFTIGCGTGFDARIMATTPADWKQRLGKGAYFVQALRLAARIESVPYRLTVDGRTIETEASIALVGNMGQLVPGLLDLRMPLLPDDGLLDVIVVGARGPIHGIQGLADQLLRTSLGGEGTDSVRIRGREVSVAADRPEPLQVDGDHVGQGSLAARVLPGALQVLVPHG